MDVCCLSCPLPDTDRLPLFVPQPGLSSLVECHFLLQAARSESDGSVLEGQSGLHLTLLIGVTLWPGLRWTSLSSLSSRSDLMPRPSQPQS